VTAIEYQLKYEMMEITQIIKDVSPIVLENLMVGTVQEEID